MSPLGEGAVVDTQVGEPAGAGGVHLEHQCGQVGARVTGGCGQVDDDRVEQRFDTDVAVGGPAEHDYRVAAQGQLAQGPAQGLLRNGTQFLQSVGVQLGDGLFQPVPGGTHQC